MKTLLAFAFLFMLTTKNSFGQAVNKDLELKWRKLVVPLRYRASLIIEMTSDLLKQNKDYKKLVYNTNILAKQISLYSDSSKKIDSKLVKEFYIKNDSLQKQGMEVLVSQKIEKDDETLMRFDVLVDKLEKSEKAINLAKKEYYEACVLYKRMDLLFENPKPKEDAKIIY